MYPYVTDKLSFYFFLYQCTFILFPFFRLNFKMIPPFPRHMWMIIFPLSSPYFFTIVYPKYVIAGMIVICCVCWLYCRIFYSCAWHSRWLTVVLVVVRIKCYHICHNSLYLTIKYPNHYWSLCVSDMRVAKLYDYVY